MVVALRDHQIRILMLVSYSTVKPGKQTKKQREKLCAIVSITHQTHPTDTATTSLLVPDLRFQQHSNFPMLILLQKQKIFWYLSVPIFTPTSILEDKINIAYQYIEMHTNYHMMQTCCLYMLGSKIIGEPDLVPKKTHIVSRDMMAVLHVTCYGQY
jgi:hypothetical protein